MIGSLRKDLKGRDRSNCRDNSRVVEDLARDLCMYSQLRKIHESFLT